MANKIYSITSLFIILLVHFLSLVNCQLPSAPALYVFGDSLVDCGNNDKLLTLARANYPPYGANFIDGPTGRFTNNETLADIIAQFLGLPLPPAFKSLDLATFNKLTGVNYASGGVGILPETGKHFGGGITFDQQIDYFQKTVESLQPQFPSPVDLQKYLAKSIVLVSIGTNDCISNYQLPLFYKTSKSYSPQTYPPVLVEKLSQQLRVTNLISVCSVNLLIVTEGDGHIRGTSVGCLSPTKEISSLLTVPWSVRPFVVDVATFPCPMPNGFIGSYLIH